MFVFVMFENNPRVSFIYGNIGPDNIVDMSDYF